MSIEIKKSVKPIEYNDAIQIMEKRLDNILNNKEKELIWFLEHREIFTGGTGFKASDILDKSIKVIKTSRGGKITCHSPGQLICYLVIDLSKRKKDIRKYIITLENSIIDTLREFKITSYSDRKNIGIWVNHKGENKKIAAIGVKVRKWITYHGFSINVNNNLDIFKKIIPCGISNSKLVKLKELTTINYSQFVNQLQKNLIKNLSVSNYF